MGRKLTIGRVLMHSITKIALIIISKIKNFVKQSKVRIKDTKIKAPK